MSLPRPITAGNAPSLAGDRLATALEAPGGAPQRPDVQGLERKWAAAWEEQGTYHFDETAPRERVFAIDTPPPTVSGSLHVGHVFGYTQADTIARYKRMRGFSVFYPEGWDDNGLPTERRVQNYFGVRCDPSVPYHPGLEIPATAPGTKDKPLVPVSRPNFVELCKKLTAQDERIFEQTWRQLGLSFDWRFLYTTIGDKARLASQRAFLRLLKKGQAYSAEAPTLWDIDFRTAVAQAELEDRERPGAFHTLVFHLSGGSALLVDTTRPELLPACVAVVVHPSDQRYRHLAGTSVTTPLFGATVPVLAHPLAQPDKGTGAAMVCTFGDVTDVTWWRELDLPVRAVVGRDGRFLPSPPGGLSEGGEAFYQEALAGRTVAQAQRAVVEGLSARAEMQGAPRPITHTVKYYEKGDRPLEIVTSRQWWIRTLDHKQALIDLGRQLQWHPAFMRARYEDWVNGLNSDWLVSRQRFFGVPFPVWYRLDAEGEPDYGSPLVPNEDQLPVDPTTDVPDGYLAQQRDQPGGFSADPDVMDTWATSSLTPQIAGGWEDQGSQALFGHVFPMDMRPQGHDIIRTWLFATVARSYLEHGTLPWAHATINGWILDPDRKKMSKSKGQVVTPSDLLDKYGSDAVRYWAASGRPGMDTAFDEAQMAVGRKLAVKLLNASKFVLGPRLWANPEDDGEGPTGAEAAARAARAVRAVGAAGAIEAVGATSGLDDVTEVVDRAFMDRLATLAASTTKAFEDFDYARALERTEAWFWDFCDNYLELVKARAYGEMGAHRAASARATLASSLCVVLKLFAPVLPFACEEVWSWWQTGSVHQGPWPWADALFPLGQPESNGGGAHDGGGRSYELAVEILAGVRRAKSQAKVGMKAPVPQVTYRGVDVDLAVAASVADDLKAAQNITELRLVPGPVPGMLEVSL